MNIKVKTKQNGKQTKIAIKTNPVYTKRYGIKKRVKSVFPEAMLMRENHTRTQNIREIKNTQLPFHVVKRILTIGN